MTDRLTRLIAGARPRYRTASAFVVDVLREAIVSGAIPEGTPLRQDDLALRFDVSRMPVREALRLLENQGLIDFQPLRGAVVAVLRTDEVVEIFETRAALETLALRRSFPSLGPARLDDAQAALDELADEGNTAQAMRLHRQFHMTLYSGAGSRLLQLVESQLDAADRYLRLERVELAVGPEDLMEHRGLLAACRDGDLAGALAILGPHIEGGGRALADTLDRARRDGAPRAGA